MIVPVDATGLVLAAKRSKLSDPQDSALLYTPVGGAAAPGEEYQDCEEVEEFAEFG